MYSLCRHMYKNINSRMMSTVILFPDKHLKYSMDNEMTIYIKGFLSRGEKPEDFNRWIDSHHTMTRNHNHRWSELAKGWFWDCGHIKYPYPIATTGHILYNGFRVTRLNPIMFATGIVADVAFYSARLYREYRHADKSTIECAERLSEDIVSWTTKYDKVRIVAHSLGCKLLLNALKITPIFNRPTTIHMLAPAIVEDEYSDILNYAARDKSYIYYCQNDAILGSILQTVKKNSIVGSSGLQYGYSRVVSKDVTDYFKDFWFVHTNYNREFPYFIESETYYRLT